MPPQIKRCYVAMLQPARGEADWERDGGLLCLGFQALGVESRFIARATPKVHEAEPRIDANLAQMSDPAWWRQWALDGVALYSWAAPRFEPVARAIAEAGLRLIVKVDCDGYKSPRQGWGRYFWSSYTILRDTRRPYPALQAAFKTLLIGVVPAAHDLPMLRHLGHAAVIGIESPEAAKILCRLLRDCRREDLAARVCLVPHPVTTDMTYDPAVSKEKLVVAVARWDAWQKDAPRLVRVLNPFLQGEPGYRVELIGTGIPELERLLKSLPPPLRARVRVVGRVPHSELRAYYRRARIIFFASRIEGCPVAGQEALCCGCTVVGAATLPSMHWLCGEGSGTLASNRSAVALATALQAEAAAWRRGARDPKRLSDLWVPRLHAPKVAQTILDAFSSDGAKR